MMLLHHDGKNYHSLMNQAQIHCPPFTDTRKPSNSTNTVTAGDAALAHIDLVRGVYVPLYNDNPFPKYQIFDDWWNTNVLLVPDHSIILSRKQVIEYMRSQDGGAHSDPAVDEKYAKFSIENGIGAMVGKPGRDIDINAPHNPDDWMEVMGAEFATVRQIAHEVLDALGEQVELKIAPRVVMPSILTIHGTPIE